VGNTEKPLKNNMAESNEM